MQPGHKLYLEALSCHESKMSDAIVSPEESCQKEVFLRVPTAIT